MLPRWMYLHPCVSWPVAAALLGLAMVAHAQAVVEAELATGTASSIASSLGLPAALVVIAYQWARQLGEQGIPVKVRIELDDDTKAAIAQLAAIDKG